MAVRPTPDSRRGLAATIASTVRASSLHDKVDAREVFELVQSELENMFQEDVFDLSRLWDHLSKNHKPDQLYPLFLGWESVITQMGLRVQLPRAVERLSRPVREKLTSAFNSGLKPEQVPIPKRHREWFASDATPLPGRLAMGAFQPNQSRAGKELDAKARRAMAEAVAWVFKNTSAAPHLNSGQLAQAIETRFDDFCDGERFQVQPLLDGLVRLPGVRPEDMLVPTYRLESFLAAHGLVLGDTGFAFDAATQVKAKAQSQAAEDLLILYPLAGRKDPHAGKRSSRPAAGRITISPRADNSDASRRTRILAVVAAVVAVFALVFLFLTRPVKGLDPSDYAVVPMVDVRLKEGAFYGVLDDQGWAAVPATDREAALQKLEAQLRKESRVRVRIYDGAGNLMVFGNDDKPYSITKSMLDQ